MKLEDQVVSLELAKKLKELGVKQESAFYWLISNTTLSGEKCYGLRGEGFIALQGAYNYVSAFTVAELYQIIEDHKLTFSFPAHFPTSQIPALMSNFIAMELKKRIVKP